MIEISSKYNVDIGLFIQRKNKITRFVSSGTLDEMMVRFVDVGPNDDDIITNKQVHNI